MPLQSTSNCTGPVSDSTSARFHWVIVKIYYWYFCCPSETRCAVHIRSRCQSKCASRHLAWMELCSLIILWWCLRPETHIIARGLSCIFIWPALYLSIVSDFRIRWATRPNRWTSSAQRFQ